MRAFRGTGLLVTHPCQPPRYDAGGITVSCDVTWQFQCLCLDVDDNGAVVFWGGSEDEEINTQWNPQ